MWEITMMHVFTLPSKTVQILKLNNKPWICFIIIIIILGISFMQRIYTYIPETNHVPREYCVATILM
jgi:hypothetical protein